MMGNWDYNGKNPCWGFYQPKMVIINTIKTLPEVETINGMEIIKSAFIGDKRLNS